MAKISSVGDYLTKRWYIHYLEHYSARKSTKCRVKKRKYNPESQILYVFIYVMVSIFQNYIEEKILVVIIV